MASGQDIDDEVCVIDSLFVRGLGCGHEMGVDLGTALGSGSTYDLTHHHKGAGGQLAAVIVGRNVGIIQEMQQTVEFLLTSSLKPGHVGMAGDFGIGDETAEADADSALHGFITGRLCDEGIGVDGVEIEGEFFDSFVRCHIQSLICVPKQMNPAELVDHPLAGAVSTHEVRDDSALIGRDDVAVLVQLAQQLLDHLVTAAFVEMEVGQAEVGHQPGPELLAVLPPRRLVHVEPGIHQGPLQDLPGHRLRSPRGSFDHLVDAAGGNSQTHVFFKILRDFVKAQPHVIAEVESEPQSTGPQFRRTRKRFVAVLRRQLAPVDLPTPWARILEQNVLFDFDPRRDDVFDDDFLGVSRWDQRTAAGAAFFLGSLFFLVYLLGYLTLGTIVTLRASRFLLLSGLPFLSRIWPRPRAVASFPFLDDTILLINSSSLLFYNSLKLLDSLVELFDERRNICFNGQHTHCRSQPAKDLNPESTRDHYTIRSRCVFFQNRWFGWVNS